MKFVIWNIEQTYRLYVKLQIWQSGFDLGYDLDLGFLRSTFEIAISEEWEGQLTLRRRDASRSFMAMTIIFIDQIKDLQES